MKEIYLAGGSFWGLQKYLNLIFGVLKTEVGYVNGKNYRTSYPRIDKTGHAEAVRVLYNSKVLPLEKLLEYYYDVINPTSLNKQGKDVGREYRSGIYYTDKQDVITIINLAKDSNKRELVPTTIQVYFPGPDDLIDLNTFDTRMELANSINDYKKTYKCEVEYAEKSNYVGKITITKIE